MSCGVSMAQGERLFFFTKKNKKKEEMEITGCKQIPQSTRKFQEGSIKRLKSNTRQISLIQEISGENQF